MSQTLQEQYPHGIYTISPLLHSKFYKYHCLQKYAIFPFYFVSSSIEKEKKKRKHARKLPVTSEIK
jgi:hypothetical protein